MCIISHKCHPNFIQVFVVNCLLDAINVREDGVMEAASGVDVMEEEEGEDDDEDDNDDDEDEEGGSDMDEDGGDMIDDSFRIYEEDDIYLPFDEGSGQCNYILWRV